jgi:hypothetical protein
MMKTEALIEMLARQAGPAPRAVVARRLGPGAALGAGLGLLGVLVLGQPVPAEILALPAWWIKLAYALVLALGAAWYLSRLARPAAARAADAWALGAAVLVMAALAWAEMWRVPADERMALWLGHSWMRCPTYVSLAALPALAGAFWALRGLAPTRPRLAGAVAGLLAGGLGAAAYAWICTEISYAFVFTWYSLGVLLMGAVGAWLGPRLLRW